MQTQNPAQQPRAPRDTPLPRRRIVVATPALVNAIRERYHIDGATVNAIHAELSGTLSRSYIHKVAIGEKRRNVPYSQRLLAWLEATGRNRAIAGLD